MVQIINRKKLEILATLFSLQYKDKNNFVYCSSENPILVDLTQEILDIAYKSKVHIDASTLMPSQEKVNQFVRDLAEILSSEFAESLTKIDCGAITIDKWKYQEEDYCVGVTLSFIENQRLEEKVLKVRFCDPDDIESCVLEILKEFELDQLPFFNFVADFETNFKDSNRLSCVANVLKEIYENSTDSVIYGNFVSKYSELVNRADLPTYAFSEPLVKYARTNFCNHFEMFHSIYENFEEILLKLTESERLPFKEDYPVLEGLVKFLQAFKDAQEHLERPGAATLYLVLPYYHKLLKDCEVKEFDSVILKVLKECVMESMKELWEPQIKTIHKAACFLYPPCKDLNIMTTAEKQEIFDFIEAQYNKMEKLDSLASSSSSQASSLFSIFQKSSSPISSIKVDIANYQNSIVPCPEDKSVIEWWHDQKDEYKCLYKIARLIHSIPAATTSCKYKFDHARSLHVECDIWKINDIMLLNHNFSTEKLKFEFDKIWTSL